MALIKNSIIQSMSIRTKIPKPVRQEMYTGSKIHTADYCNSSMILG